MRTSKKQLLLAIALLYPLGGLLAQAPAKAKESKETKTARPSDEGSQLKAATEDAGYIIGADDQLSISVWKEPEITRTVPVRPDGKISLPLINDVQASGLTPMQLALSITEKLKKFMKDEPQVTVIVVAVNSRRYYMVGEVNRAGAFPLVPEMTVLQALASAGGFSQFADVKGIYILRNENGKMARYPFNYKEVLKGNRPEQNMLLKPGDTIVVP